MFKKIVFSLVAVCVLSLALLSGGTVLAQDLNPLSELEITGDAAYGSAVADEMENENYIGRTVGNIIKIFLSVLGIIFVILLVYGGAIWMMSGGNEERITKAKQVIYRSIIGLIIIAASYGIATFVINSIIQSTISGGGGVE